MRISIPAFGRLTANTFIVQLSVAALLAGCVSESRVAYSRLDADTARIGGFDNVRMNLDASQQAIVDAAQWAPRSAGREINYLSISGGGAGGAFSVGVLKAWSERGTRPDFDVVSGVSTGALIAPLAFLGPRYDDLLVNLYTSGVARQLVERKWLPNGLLGTSLLKQEPLRAMVERYVTPEMLAAVAVEHRKGRRLMVLTTNLDTQRAVIWNMGAIASRGGADALALFRNVIIASASIPGVYPAVHIHAISGGHAFDELHSDGGASAQFLAFPDSLMTAAAPPRRRPGKRITIYVLVNNALIPEFSNVSDTTFSVMGRAYSVLVKSQTRSSLLATYIFAQRMGIDFRVAAINVQLPYSSLDPFNTNYMRAVFNLGYEEFMAGTLWKEKPVFPTTEEAIAQQKAIPARAADTLARSVVQ
jgi:predicted acylesterase/phospholipase RssA